MIWRGRRHNVYFVLVVGSSILLPKMDKVALRFGCNVPPGLLSEIATVFTPLEAQPEVIGITNDWVEGGSPESTLRWKFHPKRLPRRCRASQRWFESRRNRRSGIERSHSNRRQQTHPTSRLAAASG